MVSCFSSLFYYWHLLILKGKFHFAITLFLANKNLGIVRMCIIYFLKIASTVPHCYFSFLHNFLYTRPILIILFFTLHIIRFAYSIFLSQKNYCFDHYAKGSGILFVQELINHVYEVTCLNSRYPLLVSYRISRTDVTLARAASKCDNQLVEET